VVVGVVVDVVVGVVVDVVVGKQYAEIASTTTRPLAKADEIAT
jgi:hypothetical protein